MLDTATASHSLGEVLNLGRVTARELYATLDWLVSEQAFIETALARRHLKEGMLVLYDVTSTYLEGRCCPLAQFGYSRDHRGDRPQLVIGLLCALDGRPVAVEVFQGKHRRSDDRAETDRDTEAALQPQTRGLGGRPRHDHRRPHRGDVATGRVGLDHGAAGAGDPTTGCRRRPAATLAVNTRDMAEITSPEFPASAWWSARTRCWPTSARASAVNCWRPEKDLDRIQKRVQRANNPLRGAGEIGKAVGAIIGKRKMAKHFETDIKDHSFSFVRNAKTIAEQAKSTAFTSCAPAWRPSRPMPPRPCAPTRASPGSSAPSAA